MKKKIVLVIISIVLLVLCLACLSAFLVWNYILPQFKEDKQDSDVMMVNDENEKNDKNSVSKDVNIKESAVKVELNSFSENNKEYAVIRGMDNNDAEIWSHTTGYHERTELEQISEIGMYENQYYYCEGGKAVSLSLADGSVLWENNEFGGASAHSAIDNNGTVYMCGYYGPSFFAVDKNGKTLGKIDSFGDEYYWPYEIEIIDDSTVAVTLEHGPDQALSENEGFVFYVDLSDYSFSPIGIDTVNIFSSMPSNFSFTSGAGAWSTELTLESDGSFTGYYHDSDMGDAGSEYPNGTVYICNFTGEFSTPEQVNDYTYSMRLENLQKEGTTGEEYYENGQRFIYSDPYGFDNASEFFIYTPDAPMSELPDGFKSWLTAFINPNEEETLSYYGIYNVGGEEGFVAFDHTPIDIENVPEEQTLDINSIREQVVDHYTKLWQPDGTYTCFENEDIDNGDQIIFTLRYAMSDEKAQELIENGGMVTANALVTTITVNKDTGEVYDNDGFADPWTIER